MKNQVAEAVLGEYYPLATRGIPDELVEGIIDKGAWGLQANILRAEIYVYDADIADERGECCEIGDRGVEVHSDNLSAVILELCLNLKLAHFEFQESQGLLVIAGNKKVIFV